MLLRISVCDSLESGVGAVFGPAGSEATTIIQSICDSMEIPHIETHWRSMDNPRRQPSYYVNVYPDPVILGRGYTAIVPDMDWTSFTLLYQRDEALLRLQDLIQDYSGTAKPSDAEASAVAIIKLPENNDFRYGLRRGRVARFRSKFKIVPGGGGERVRLFSHSKMRIRLGISIGIIANRH